MRDFADEKGCLVQKHSSSKYNAIDSNFLTTNFLYQEYICDPGNIFSLKKVYCFINKESQFTRYWKDEGFDTESSNWTEQRTVSRDNSMGAFCCLVELEDTVMVRYMAMKIIKRKSFFQNVWSVKGIEKTPDYCIAEWSVILRGIFDKKNSWKLYVLYYLFDFLFLLSTVIYIVKNYTDNNYNSPLFHMVSQVECINRRCSTFWGKISKWLMYNFIPGNKIYTHSEPVVSQVLEYSRAHYDPPVYEVTEKILRKYRNG